MGDIKREICRAGLHPMSGDNLIIHKKSGHRQCRACRNVRALINEAEKRARKRLEKTGETRSRQEISDSKMDEISLNWLQQEGFR